MDTQENCLIEIEIIHSSTNIKPLILYRNKREIEGKSQAYSSTDPLTLPTYNKSTADVFETFRKKIGNSI